MDEIHFAPKCYGFNHGVQVVQGGSLLRLSLRNPHGTLSNPLVPTED